MALVFSVVGYRKQTFLELQSGPSVRASLTRWYPEGRRSNVGPDTTDRTDDTEGVPSRGVTPTNTS